VAVEIISALEKISAGRDANAPAFAE